MRTVLFKISKIVSKAPSEDWLDQIKTLLKSQSETELAEVANQFEEMLFEVGKIQDSFALKHVILDDLDGGLVIPGGYVKGSRGRPPLTMEAQKERAAEGVQNKY